MNLKNNGFHKLCSSELKKVIGNKDFYIIRDLLLNYNEPIIEINNSWQNSADKNNTGYCQGYRLSSKYNTGEYIFKNLLGKMERQAQLAGGEHGQGNPHPRPQPGSGPRVPGHHPVRDLRRHGLGHS